MKAILDVVFIPFSLIYKRLLSSELEVFTPEKIKIDF